MNYLEAIRSGKPLRRKSKETWGKRPSCSVGMGSTYLVPAGTWITREILLDCVSIEDIVADDWEVKQEPREWMIYTMQGIWFVSQSPPGFEMTNFHGTVLPQEVVHVREVLPGEK